MEKKYDCNKRSQNLKHKIGFIIKNNESLFENKMKNKIEQLLSKYNNDESVTDTSHVNIRNKKQ